MAKEKDIVVRRRDGLFVTRRSGGGLGFTDFKNATHFTGKSVAKKEFPQLRFHNVKYIDLNDRRNKKYG